MTEPLLRRLLSHIRAEGPIPFDEYMEMALYDPSDGYYTAGRARTGWDGHFLTSPEVDPGFGWLWARALHEIWVATGEPERFEVIEIGPGEGGLASSILGVLKGRFSDAVRYTLVEHSPANRDRQRSLIGERPSVRWVETLDALSSVEAGCVVAHEILDNLPVKVLERDGESWSEIFVGEQDGRLVEVATPADPALIDALGARRTDGCSRVEVPIGAEVMVQRIGSLLGSGAAIFVDYGYAEASRHPNGTLTSYSERGADTDALDDPGSKDITVHVDWTWLAAASERAGMTPHGPAPQRSVLKRLGADELDAALRARFEKATTDRQGAAAVRALSRRQALGVLTDPRGLGGLEVLVATRGAAGTPSWIET